MLGLVEHAAAAADAAQDEDRIWFSHHPKATRRVRPTIPHEFCGALIFGGPDLLPLNLPHTPYDGLVGVTVIAKGIRSREPLPTEADPFLVVIGPTGDPFEWRP